MADRNQIFQRLKPPCVALSQSALALNSPQGDVRQLTTRLEALKNVLDSVTLRPASLDGKLADYVFFPLSQVLKSSQRVSIRSLELSLQCLAVLLEHGWRSQIQPPLAAQIVILCTLMAEENPKGLSSAESTDELRTSALQCLRCVFEVGNESSELRDQMTAEQNVPQLGQTISTVLDGVLTGRSVAAQLEGVRALQTLVQRVMTRDLHAAFLPGIASKLTKVLTPGTIQRRNHEVLVIALDTLAYLFRSTLSDEVTKQFLEPPQQETRTSPDTKPLSKAIDLKWLETAAAQLKPAISSIIKTQEHDRSDVREALARLCLTVLHCRQALASSSSMCLEAILSLSAGTTGGLVAAQLEMMISQDSAMVALLQSTLHSSLSSLSTSMQAADGEAKIQRIQQIKIAYEILISIDADTSLIGKMLATALSDSVVTTLLIPSSQSKESPAVHQMQSLELDVRDSDRDNRQYPQPLVKHRSQYELFNGIEQLARTITGSAASTFTADLSRALQQTSGEPQIAAFWLLLNATHSALQRTVAVSQILHLNPDSRSMATEHLEELYSFALEVLADRSDEVIDPRLQSLALRVLALQSQTAGEDFRHELIDALYPVLHCLATPDTSLQQDSVTTLNILAESCGYPSVKSLIVENVDYLTNAVALRLNAFDVSPQGPQVLLMMVRLAGPSLLPYLEDTVDSIFAALEDYHGYPLLVELLFRVLSVIAEEGVKNSQLSITTDTSHDAADYYDDRWLPVTISGLADLLDEQSKEQECLAAERDTPSRGHLKQPWGKSPVKHESTSSEDAQADDEQQQGPVDIPDPPPPATKTYALLLRISELTQHFLPSASSSLRASLLKLITTTTPAIARHENSFLPLVNTLWPEVVSRLDDPEPYVVATALDMVATLCEHAGGFMRTRIQQLWPDLCAMHHRVSTEVVQNVHSHYRVAGQDPRPSAGRSDAGHFAQALARMRASPADYTDTSTRLLWNSLVSLISAVVKRVSLTPEMFDEALDMLDSMLDDEQVRNDLEAENADAVWLVLLRDGKVSMPVLRQRHSAVRSSFVELAG
ncbi:Putative armadillo-like helical protein [Septoria linicola]|uniref:Armadillo-like helical protein n=1 Tax=Septoria linicola TaxID=215465 RepID=A0A9Q9APF7_9PEZI|nr:putative armadillo-like helical protein [Septoria linicola]USW52670.1 Putative armadillo-like helical protein [Septoria linicola]